MKSNKTLIESIHYISDLHFDFYEGKYEPSKSKLITDDFLSVLKKNFSNKLILIAGDLFNDYTKTLAMIKTLNNNKVTGFLVLGNHDYWNNAKFTYDEIIVLFKKETMKNKYFRLLCTGRQYKIGDITFIGDTGWTSFNNGKKYFDFDKKKILLPEHKMIKEFKFSNIKKLHNDWIEYANTMISTQDKLIIVTHFPMINLGMNQKDLWWSSKTDILETNNYWNVYGHTHNNNIYFRNHITKQIGYYNMVKGLYNIRNADVEYYYSKYDFGVLNRLSQSTDIVNIKSYIMDKYYNSNILNIDNKNEIIEVEKRGFKRCAANKRNISALSKSPIKYIQRVRKLYEGFKENMFIGYVNNDKYDEGLLKSIEDSINILETGNISNVKEYMTAAVITGYVWNGMPYLISSMRTLDDYDILRFYLMFLTIQEYKISHNEIESVVRHKKHFITYGNVNIYIPLVNKKFIEVGKLLENNQIINLITTEERNDKM